MVYLLFSKKTAQMKYCFLSSAVKKEAVIKASPFPIILNKTTAVISTITAVVLLSLFFYFVIKKIDDEIFELFVISMKFNIFFGVICYTFRCDDFIYFIV